MPLIGHGSSAQVQAVIKAIKDAQLLQIEIKPIGSDNGYSKLIAWQIRIADDLAKNLYLDGNRDGLESRENNLILAYFKARNNIDVPPLEAATVNDKAPKQLELKLEKSDDEDYDYSWNSGPSM